MPAPNVPNIADGNELFSAMMRAFHQWEAGELWEAVNAFFEGRLISTTGTSATSNTIGTGDKTFATQAGLGYVPGMPVNVVNTANPANYMSGFVKSYSGTSLVVTVITTGGSGTLSAWSIALGLSGGGASLGANSFTGAQNFAQGTDIAAANTTNLDTATGNAVVITGNTAINAWTLSNGRIRYGVIAGTPTIAYNATTSNINTGGRSYTCEGGERFIAFAAGGVVYVEIIRADGQAINDTSKIQPITASVGGSALTVTLNPTILDFRSSSLNSGAVNTRKVNSAISLNVSSGSTLGTINSTAARLILLAIDNAGTIELAIVNSAGGLQLDETNLISTTAEGGAGGADSANVIYSTTARSNVPYRVVGFIELTQTTAGTWATSPSLIQGIGGVALTSLASLGYGQAVQDLTASRAYATTYTNSTNRPRFVTVANQSCNANQSTLSVNINGAGGVPFARRVDGGASTSANASGSFIVPPGATYSVTTSAGTLSAWYEAH